MGKGVELCIGGGVEESGGIRWLLFWCFVSEQRQWQSCLNIERRRAKIDVYFNFITMLNCNSIHPLSRGHLLMMRHRMEYAALVNRISVALEWHGTD
jgi:hypothetical protein